MNVVQNTTAKIKNNPIPALIGGALGFVASKKLLKGKKNYYVMGASVLAGVIAGAMVGSTIKSKKGAPNKELIQSGTK
jgi:outer membrane lipoprotein SlyB